MKLKKHMNPKYTQIACYVVVTAVTIFLLVWFWNNLWFVWSAISSVLGWFAAVLTPVILGFALSYILSPLVGFYEKQLNKLPFFKKKDKSHRGLAVILVFLTVLAILALILTVLISVIMHQFTFVSVDSLMSTIKMYEESLNGFYKSMEKMLRDLNIKSPEMHEILAKAGDILNGLLQKVIGIFGGAISNIGSIFANLIFVIIFSIYFLLDGKKLGEYWDRVLKALSSKRSYSWFHRFMEDADRIFSGYIRGQLIDAVIVAFVTGISQTLIGTPYAAMIGLLVGIGNLIPYVGSVVGYVSITLVSLIDWNLGHYILAVALFFILQTLDANLVQPKLLSTNINAHPMLIIVAIILGGSVGGLLGMLVAVPVVSLIKVQFERIIDNILERRKSKDDELPPN